jgi:hypothetical protein
MKWTHWQAGDLALLVYVREKRGAEWRESGVEEILSKFRRIYYHSRWTFECMAGVRQPLPPHLTLFSPATSSASAPRTTLPLPPLSLPTNRAVIRVGRATCLHAIIRLDLRCCVQQLLHLALSRTQPRVHFAVTNLYKHVCAFACA